MEAPELSRWLEERLTGARAEREWRALVEGGYTSLLGRKLLDIASPQAIEALTLRYLTKRALPDLVRPIVRAGLVPIVRRMRGDRERIGRWVPADAETRILDLVSKKGFVDPSWIRAAFREEAIEAIVADTLYEALRDFSLIVPRLVQAFSPLGKIARLGLGDRGAGIGARVLEEIQRRLEPEIKSFLEKGTRRALEGAATFTVEHLEDPSSIAFRRNMASFIFERDGAFHVSSLADDALAEIDAIAERIAEHVAERDESKTIVEKAVKEIADRHGERALRDLLLDVGVKEAPPFDAWAAASWPVVVAFLRAPAVGAWLEGLSGEILEAVRTCRTQATPPKGG